MKEFWALVGNSIKLKRHKRSRYGSSRWWKIYAIAAFILALGGTAYAIYQGQFTPYVILGIIPALYFIAFAFSLSSITREWKGQTVSWWLTLPYPRGELLLAKLVASFFRLLRIAVWFIAFLVIIALMGRLLNPAQWTITMLANFIQSWVLFIILTLLVSPLAMNLGMLLALTMRAPGPWTPLVWVVVMSLLGLSNGYIIEFSKLVFVSISSTIAFMAVIIIPMLILTVIIFGISCYLLAEHTEV